MTTFEALDRALVERKKEWDDKAGVELPQSYHSNELAGEIAEAIEALDGLVELGKTVKVCNTIKKLEREAYGLPGSRATKDAAGLELADVIICAAKQFNRLGLDAGEYVRRKFNETSDKIGLKTKMRFERSPDRFDALSSY